MITELKKEHFTKCEPLLHSVGVIEANAVVKGVNMGRIFVDNETSPTSGLIWLGNNDGFIFIGNEENKEFTKNMNEFVNKVIAPEAKKAGLDWFEGIGNHPKWNKSIERMFKERKLGSWNQRVYTLHKDHYISDAEPCIDDEYSLLKISPVLFGQMNYLKNIEFVESKLLETWSTLERFFETGTGYVILYNNEIVSSCLSQFVVNNIHTIDIETLEKHQGKKLAQKVANSFVKDCLANNKIPYWDCMEGNKASIAVAEKLGFTKAFDYVGYEFPL